MKRIIYIALTMFLGLLLSFFVHVALEMPVLNYLVEGGAKVGETPLLTWTQWAPVHRYSGITIALFGIVGGWFLGRSWWYIVYVEKRRFKWHKRSATMRT